MIKTFTIALYTLLLTLSVKAKEIKETFEAAQITLTFTSGATKDKIVHIVKGDVIHVLVPHHAQNIYDPDDYRKYKYTVSHTPLNGWEKVKEDIAEPTIYEVKKKAGTDEIAPATKELIYTLKLKRKAAEETSESDNSPEAEDETVEYKIIIYTPSIHLTLHAASTHGSMGEKMKRPTTKKADTVEGFDTGYLGAMQRNEDNDDGDQILPLVLGVARDNDDLFPSSKDDDLVAVLMELKQPAGMPDELKQLVVVNLLFKKSTKNEIQVFDEGKVPIKLDVLSNPKNLSEPGGDKHLSKLIKDGRAYIYLEGLGLAEGQGWSGTTNKWGTSIDQVTLRLTTGAKYKESDSHGLLVPMEVEVEVVTRKNPKANFDNTPDSERKLITLNGTDIAYAGNTAVQDHLAIRIKDKSIDIKNWKAMPSAGYGHLNEISGPLLGSEWLLDGNGGRSFNWQPGKYDIQVEIDSGSIVLGSLEVGIRSDHVIVIGWIDETKITLPAAAQGNLQRALPRVGVSEWMPVGQKVYAGQYIKQLSEGIDVSVPFDVDPPTIAFSALKMDDLSAVDKTYTLNWMFKYASNPEPPNTFRNDDGVFDVDKLVTFILKEQNAKGIYTNFKLLNVYQVQFRVTIKNEIDYSNFDRITSVNIVGNTKDPAKLYSVNGQSILGGFVYRGAVDEGYPKDGVFVGFPGPNQGKIEKNKKSVIQHNEGRPDNDALKAFKTLTGEDQGEIWSSIRIFSDIASYSKDKFTRSPEPNKSGEAKINTQVYPTYHIYINGKNRAVWIQRQADEPSALFPNKNNSQ